jgi:hypothetical protein
MRRYFHVLALSATVLSLTACSDDSARQPGPKAGTVVSQPSPPPPPPPSPVASRPGSTGNASQAAPQQQPVAQPHSTILPTSAASESSLPMSAPPQPGAQPAPTAVGAGATPKSQPTATASQPPPTPSAGQLPLSAASGQQSIRLAMGVALPQTGPEGIMMSFSVEYEVIEAQPDRAAEYVCVVERERGKPAKISVRLARQGALPIILNGWRPEEGPFQLHFEDRHGHRLSASIELN